jgi:hypothetical protein
MNRAFAPLGLALALASLSALPARAEERGNAASASKVTLLRTPGGGIQPQAVVDDRGVIHLIYYTGDPRAGDVNYVRSEDGESFSPPLRVNSQAGSVIAAGNVRGAHLAVGKNGRVHVAWMGAHSAAPRGPNNASPMLYSRLTVDGAAFEPQRNVIASAYGLDGGGSVAADRAGNVYVAWHASPPGEEGEENRCVWIARSSDDGKTFAPEQRASDAPTGACGCCGMRAFADSQGAIYALYRSATSHVNRDMRLLTQDKGDSAFENHKLQSWKISTCPMSTAAFAEGGDGVVAAWETDGQVYFARIDSKTQRVSAPIAAPGHGKGRKHPAVAGNALGETLLVWTEGMGWNKGGSLAWQAFDPSDEPIGETGRAKGVPVWSLVAVVTRPEGGFAVIY